MTRPIDELLNKKMDRSGFIKHVGVGALALFGVGSAIKAITTVTQQKPVSNVPAAGVATSSMAYGASAYGGKKV